MHGLEPALRQRILAVIERYLPPDRWSVWLFGSFARGEADVASDVDLAVEGPAPLPSDVAARVVAALEDEVPLLRDYDLVDVKTAPPALRARIEREGERWTQPIAEPSAATVS